MGQTVKDVRRARAVRVGATALLALMAVSGSVAFGPATAVAATFKTTGTVDQRVEQLLAQMTLDEKVGQMSQLSEGGVSTGPGGTVGLEDSISRGLVGSVLNSTGTDRTRALQKLAVEKTRLGIPLIFGQDVIHGYKTIFPIPLGEACSWDLDAMKLSAHVAATEAKSDGVHWTFAPMVDIARDPRWGRIAEGAGEDPYLGQLIARARVQGFQGNDLTAPDSVIACVKHFAAYGAVRAGRDYNTVDISQRVLLETYLPPYKAAVDAGARTVMSAFNEFDGVPASGNQFLLDGTLKRKWGFKGFVVSDWAAIEQMVDHGFSTDLKEAAEQSANAGMDMDMQSNAFFQHLAAHVRAGKVPQAVVDEAVRRILRVKFETGLFDDPYRACDNARRDRVMMSAAHLAASRDVARKSIVLLKNQNRLLPLGAGTKTVALVGPLAGDRPNMLGSWACLGDGEKCLSVEDGLKARGVKLVTAEGCAVEGTDRSGFKAAVDAAKQADVIVAVVGEASGMTGEASSRAYLGLPGVQQELLAALKTTGKPIVMVMMNGRPLTVEWENANVDALLEAWQLGTQAGPAIADVLYGDYNPSGHLVSTFPRAVGQIPLSYDHTNTGRPFDAKNHYTTHYMDVSNDPLFPFGYGLSYTRFDYSPLTLSTQSLAPNGTLRVEVTVKNSGDRDGEEVAQLYVRDVVGSVNRPMKQLKGFRKVMIKKGASAKLSFDITARDLAFYRKDMSYGAEAGQFKVWVGPNADTGSEGSFALTQTVSVPE